MKRRSIAVFLSMIMAACLFTVPIHADTATVAITVRNQANYDYAWQVFDMVNQARVENGHKPLTMDADLLNAAMQRSGETAYYFSHSRPDGSMFYTINGKMDGENIAAGQYTPEEVMRSWKESQGHWDNILSDDYLSIGIGCYRWNNGNIAWVQDFGRGAATSVARRTDTVEEKYTFNAKLDNVKVIPLFDDYVVLGPGEQYEMSACGRDMNSSAYIISAFLDNSCVTYTSDNPSIATVTNDGLITTKVVGTARVYAKVGNATARLFVRCQSSRDMYRLYNPNSGEHFYTGSTEERDNLAVIGWNYEGVGWTAPVTSKTPVFRMYNENGGEHHYTTNTDERDYLVTMGWSYEGIGWYSDDWRTRAVFRQYNPNAFSCNHNYTTSEEENDYLVSLGWSYEGVGWYACS